MRAQAQVSDSNRQSARILQAGGRAWIRVSIRTPQKNSSREDWGPDSMDCYESATCRRSAALRRSRAHLHPKGPEGEARNGGGGQAVQQGIAIPKASMQIWSGRLEFLTVALAAQRISYPRRSSTHPWCAGSRSSACYQARPNTPAPSRILSQVQYPR